MSVPSSPSTPPAHSTPAHSPAPAYRPLRDKLKRWEFYAIALVGIAMLAFGSIVVKRSAFQNERKTDLDVFLRAAWAVRANEDIYATFSERGWNYVYPSTFAILLTPIAEPPTEQTFLKLAADRQRFGDARGLSPQETAQEVARFKGEAARLNAKLNSDRSFYITFWISCVLWYLASLAMILFSAHLLARAIEIVDERLSDLHWRDRGWWMLRLWPVIFCAPGLFNGLSRGQSDALVLLCVSGFVYLTVARKGRFAMWSGFCLAGAVAVKIIPALLIVYPLFKRDLRTLVGFACGLLLLIVVIPSLIFGPAQALEYNLQWLRVMGAPGLGNVVSALSQGDTSRKFELYGLSGTESQSLVAVAHNLAHLTTPRGFRPEDADWWSRPLLVIVGGSMLLITLMAAGWRSVPAITGGLRERAAAFVRWPTSADPVAPATIGLLLCVMLVVTPVCHTHYFAFALPIVVWLVSRGVREHPQQALSSLGWLLGFAYLAAHALPRLPGLEILQDMGLMMFTGIAVFLLAAKLLRETRRHSPCIN